MQRLLTISREALAELLQAAGSPLTPEQYLASLPETTIYARYAGRAKAAMWSKYVLLVVAVLSVFLLPMLIRFSWPSLVDIVENLIIVVGLVVVTTVEYRVHRYFVEHNPQAPGLGFRNQAAFAAAILIYGLYHAWRAQPVAMPPGFDASDPALPIDPASLQKMMQAFYLLIGFVGATSQFGLAWYYRSAKAPTL